MTHDKIEISDMVQHKIVSLVASHDVLREKTIFKGGTMLRVCMFENYRFSEDLDFALVDIEKIEFFDIFRQMVSDGFDDTIFMRMPNHHPSGTQYVEWVKGDDEGMIVVETAPVLPFEISDTVSLPVLDNHPEVTPTTDVVTCASLLSVATAKYNCVGNRFKGRDLYDFYYCIAENILPKAWENYLKYWQQFNRPVPPDKVINRFRYLESDYRRSWKKDQLAEYIPYTENFDVIYPYLLEYLDSIW